METLRRLIILFVSLSIYVGCSDVEFQVVPSDTCERFNDDGGICEQTEQGFNTYNIEFKTGKVDILFVVDNSGSMSIEQAQMADKFPSLLDKIADLDYQLAITTTDIETDQGHFLPFPNGSKMLTAATHGQNLDWFRNTIQRNETLVCDSNNYAEDFCPSNDERGIYAVNLALDHAENSTFFRDSATLHIVFLSDEDERGVGRGSRLYPFDPYDEPQTLVDKIRDQLGITKAAQFHAVTVAPGDQACLIKQHVYPANATWPIKGREGKVYAELVSPTSAFLSQGNFLPGVQGSICAADYGAQLGEIGDDMQIKPIQLPCAPRDGEVEVVYDRYPGIDIQYSLSDTDMLTILTMPPEHTKVRITFSCPVYL